MTGESQSSNTRDKIAVALAVDDWELRARVLRALNGCTERFVVADDCKGADVLLTDAIATRRPLPPELPVILIGGAGTLYDAVQRGYAGSLLPSFADRKLQIAIEAAAHGLICTEAHNEFPPYSTMKGRALARRPNSRYAKWRFCNNSSPAPPTRRLRAG